MIDFVKQTPECYSKQSLDYQIIARLYTALFNLTKLYTDNMSIWSSDIDNKLIKLRAKTLNFKIKHSWNLDELEAITSCFKYLIANKGSLNTLEYCISILLKVLGLNSIVTIDNVSVDYDRCYIVVYADVNEVSTGLIEDLVEHLLPAGWRYRIIKYKESIVSNKDNVEVYYMQPEPELTSEPWTKKMFIGSEEDRFFDTTHIYTDSEGRLIEGGGEV